MTEGNEMKPLQVEYWCGDWFDGFDGFAFCTGPIMHRSSHILNPSDCVWIVPYVNPWLSDWGKSKGGAVKHPP